MVVLGDRRIVFEQANRARNQVVKVQGIGLRKALLIFFVSRGNNSRNWVIRRGISVFLPRDELILEVRNTRGNQLGRESFNIHIRCFQHHLDQALRVLRIIDTESRSQTGRTVFRTQQSHTRRVEGRHPHPARSSPTNQRLDTLTHLSCCLIGECNRQNLTRTGLTGCQKVRNPMRQNARLPRARTGHDEQRHSAVFNRCALLVIQALEKALRVTVLRPTTLAAYLSPLSRSLAQRSNRRVRSPDHCVTRGAWVVEGKVLRLIGTEVEERAEIGK